MIIVVMIMSHVFAYVFFFCQRLQYECMEPQSTEWNRMTFLNIKAHIWNIGTYIFRHTFMKT